MWILHTRRLVNHTLMILKMTNYVKEIVMLYKSRCGRGVRAGPGVTLLVIFIYMNVSKTCFTLHFIWRTLRYHICTLQMTLLKG